EAQAEDPARGAALVLPGSGFAHHDWGWTLDEPLVVLGGVRVVARSQVPLVPGQTIRFLDALDRDLTRGSAGGALVDQLTRAGIGHVVVRHDLDRAATGSPDPAATLAALERAGLEPEAAFGGSEEQPAVQVFAVRAAASLPVVRTTEAKDVLQVAGAPETALGLQDLGLLQPGQATVLAGDATPDGGASDAGLDVSTDGAQRRERAFGRVDESTSVVLGPDDPWRVRRAAHDYPGADDEQPVVAGYRGLASVTASSSQGYADTFGPVTPQDGPHAAIDGLLDTRWVSSVVTRGDRQWWRARFSSPRVVREVEVLPAVQDGALLTIRSIEVVAGDQRREVQVPAGGAPVRVALDGSRVPSVEVRITGVRNRDTRGRVGLREIWINGTGAERHLVAPAEVDARTAWAARTVPARRACLPRGRLPDCSTDRIRSAEEADGMVRRWTFTEGGRWQLGGRALARAGLAASRLLEPLDRQQTVIATSVFGDDPQVSARFAHDGDPRTAWLSAGQDRVPALVLQWDRPRRVRGLRVVAATGPAADLAPVAALVRSGAGVQRVALGGEVAVPLDPVRTRRLEIAFVPREGRDRVAVGELQLLGPDVTVPFDPATPTGAVCGLGPPVQVAGRSLPTRVAGTMGDVVDGTPLTWSTCDPGAPGDEGAEDEAAGEAEVAPVDRGTAVEIPAGTHDVRAAPSAEFAALTLGARPSGADPPDAGEGAARDVTVRGWEDDRRTLQIAAGPRALLWLPHSLSDGWVAELDGERLEAQRVDGWQQGWWLPAGAGGAVEIRFAPQGTYDVVLPGGLAVSSAVLLAGLLTLPGAVRRSRERPTRPWPAARPTARGRRVRARRLSLVALLVVWGVVAGPVAALATGVALAAVRRRRVQWWLVAVLGAAPLLATLLDLGGGWWQVGLA
ncbi:MAG: alpha-(1-_3)-arabinofuranosyltransferase family protein, partial [Nocardioides sp.]|nr:alpha-(1->3)-arabinofuranosyltransferase family protein [Nocardioides sp.]